MPTLETIISLISAIGVVVLGFLEWKTRRKKVSTERGVDQADAAERITNSATQLVEQLQQELETLRPLPTKVAHLENEVLELRKANERLIDWSERLVKQITDAKMEPVPFRIEPKSDRFRYIRTEPKHKAE